MHGPSEPIRVSVASHGSTEPTITQAESISTSADGGWLKFLRFGGAYAYA